MATATENIQQTFKFKQFEINQDKCAMKVGTDGVLLGAWTDVSDANSALDIGAGTGVIALMLAQRLAGDDSFSHAVEIDDDAYTQCVENFKTSPFAAKTYCFLDSIQNFAKTVENKYDVIVSNPPFFSGGTFSSTENKTAVRHTVKLPHGDLLHATKSLLNPNGKFCVVLPFIEGLRFIEVATSYGFYLTKRTDVLPKAEKSVERLLLQFENTPKPLVQDKIILQNSVPDRIYTDQYKELTKDFYTIF